MNQCKHKNVTFIGMYSLIGNYVCDDCKEKIDPIEYHRIEGLPHFELQIEDYPTEHQSKIKQYWRERESLVNPINPV